MIDSELLGFAARALGGSDVVWTDIDGNRYTGDPERPWNPIKDDGDALCTAVALQMDILQDEHSISIKKWCQVKCESVFLAEQQIGELSRSIATRMAIVRAASEIGKSMSGESH